MESQSLELGRQLLLQLAQEFERHPDGRHTPLVNDAAMRLLEVGLLTNGRRDPRPNLLHACVNQSLGTQLVRNPQQQEITIYVPGRGVEQKHLHLLTTRPKDGLAGVRTFLITESLYTSILST